MMNYLFKKLFALAFCAICAAALCSCSLFYITRREAVKIALEHEGISGDNCTFVSADLDESGDEPRWEIEFYKDSMEYDYTIDARSGEIIAFDHDIEGFVPSTWPSPNEGTAV